MCESTMLIVRRKDTINYRVNAFTSKQDRVIADSIGKLPGIAMVGMRYSISVGQSKNIWSIT